MKLPEYITGAEVRKVCKEIGIRDWTKLKEPKIVLCTAESKKMGPGRTP